MRDAHAHPQSRAPRREHLARDVNRRELLFRGGALIVAVCWGDAIAQDASPALSASFKAQPMVDGWIRISSDGRVTVFTGKAELGQGIKTALIQVAAEELVVQPSSIELVSADTERTPDEGYTSGSHSMQDSGTAIRQACAQAREALTTLAAQRLAVAVPQLTLRDGGFNVDDRRVSYGELMSNEADASNALHVAATGKSPARDPKLHTLVGQPMHRVDIPAKVSGGVAYVQDIRIEGMVHARIVRPPSPDSKLLQLDTALVEAMPGVMRVVRDGRFIAVIAQREFQAVSAARALADAARWDAGTQSLPVQDRIYESLLASESQDHTILDRGIVDELAQNTDINPRIISASYRRPYHMHGSIGPSCAVAQQLGTKFTVWTHTQGVFPLRKALAEMLGFPLDQVRCVHSEGSGCYGHNGADDVAADAALLARAMPGRAVRVQWSREDEHGWEPYGPAMITSAKATLDESGGIKDWLYEVWSNTHSTRPGAAGDLLAATYLAQPFAPTPPKPIPLPEGGGDRNAIPIYSLPNARVVHHFLPQMPLRVSALRSLGAYMNVFSIECFMDELARGAAADPVEFRVRHLTDPRAHEVIQLAAERFGWSTFARRPGCGRGFAFARYKNLAAFAAIACEVEVWRDTGEVRVARVVAAVDSGEAVNPDGIRNQIEGGIVQSMSWTLLEEVTFNRHHTTSLDWGGYPILRFGRVPGRIDVHIVERPGQPFLGTGEAAQGPAAAAIANAVADATGVRMRELPLSKARVRSALGV
jgi:nicotinate dehydrogenase subunit B